MTTFLTRSGILRYVCSPVIEFDTPGLDDPGVPFVNVRAGTFIYDCGVFVPVGFDGTTPFADIGTFVSGATTGLGGTFGSVFALNLRDNTIRNRGLAGFVTPNPIQCLMVSNSTPFTTPIRVTVAGALTVVASQDGSKGGAPIGGTVGQLVAWAVVSG